MLEKAQIKLIRSSKNAVFAALVIIGTIALYNQIIVTHINYSHAAQTDTLVMEKGAKKEGVIRTCALIKKKKLEELQDKFKDIHIKLFNSVKAEEFFSDIQAMAEQANCVVYSLNFSPVKTAAEETGQSRVTNNISTNSVKLTVAGGYTDIVNLIASLQSRPKQVWIDSISIEPADDSGRLNCELTARIYIIHDKWGRYND